MNSQPERSRHFGLRLLRSGCKQYRNRTMWCAPGTHEAAMSLLKRFHITGGPTLDLGAGSGAFTRRLVDCGYSDLFMADIDARDLDHSTATVLELNLDRNFYKDIPLHFNLIVSIEVIEHLESPRSLIRNCYRLLRDNGYVLLTTPNISHWLGRIRFLATGQLRYFSDANYRKQGHISIISHNLMKSLLSEVGFEILHTETAGSFWRVIPRALILPLSIFAKLTLGRFATGDVSIYLAQKTKASSPPSEAVR